MATLVSDQCKTTEFLSASHTWSNLVVAIALRAAAASTLSALRAAAPDGSPAPPFQQTAPADLAAFYTALFFCYSYTFEQLHVLTSLIMFCVTGYWAMPVCPTSRQQMLRCCCQKQ